MVLMKVAWLSIIKRIFISTYTLYRPTNQLVAVLLIGLTKTIFH